jgi:hypothetical protein
MFFGGVLNFSKQGWLTPPTAWLVAALAAGHNFSRKQLFGIVAAYVFFSMYLVPYSQVGRDYREEVPTIASDWKTAQQFLFSLPETRQQYKAIGGEVSEHAEEIPHLYDTPQGFIDRLNMLTPDDAIIAYTEEGNYESLYPTYVAFTNIIPHFIWADKPYFYTGNTYAREIGMIGDEDFTTGISFTPAGDAYHQAGWFGLPVLAGVLFMLFMVMDSLSGDVRISPWGLLFVVVSAHNAPEGLIGGQVYVATYTAFGVVIVALMTRYVLPILSGIVTNTERTRVDTSAVVRRGAVGRGPLARPAFQSTPPASSGLPGSQEP